MKKKYYIEYDSYLNIDKQLDLFNIIDIDDTIIKKIKTFLESSTTVEDLNKNYINISIFDLFYNDKIQFISSIDNNNISFNNRIHFQLLNHLHLILNKNSNIILNNKQNINNLIDLIIELTQQCITKKYSLNDEKNYDLICYSILIFNQLTYLKEELFLISTQKYNEFVNVTQKLFKKETLNKYKLTVNDNSNELIPKILNIKCDFTIDNIFDFIIDHSIKRKFIENKDFDQTLDFLLVFLFLDSTNNIENGNKERQYSYFEEYPFKYYHLLKYLENNIKDISQKYILTLIFIVNLKYEDEIESNKLGKTINDKFIIDEINKILFKHLKLSKELLNMFDESTYQNIINNFYYKFIKVDILARNYQHLKNSDLNREILKKESIQKKIKHMEFLTLQIYIFLNKNNLFNNEIFTFIKNIVSSIEEITHDNNNSLILQNNLLTRLNNLNLNIKNKLDEEYKKKEKQYLKMIQNSFNQDFLL